MTIETLTQKTAHLTTEQLRDLADSAERIAVRYAQTEGQTARTAAAWMLARCYGAIVAAR